MLQCYMIPNRCLLFWFGEGSISADKNLEIALFQFSLFSKSIHVYKETRKKRSITPKTKPKKHTKCVGFVHLRLGVFCFPSYLGWCQHPTWKPTMATSSNCSIRSRRARRSHHSCQKPSEEQETWELRGQREMPSNSPKTYEINGWIDWISDQTDIRSLLRIAVRTAKSWIRQMAP